MLRKIDVYIPCCSSEQFSDIERYLDTISFNGLNFNPKSRKGFFMLDEKINPDSLKIPSPCRILPF